MIWELRFVLMLLSIFCYFLLAFVVSPLKGGSALDTFYQEKVSESHCSNGVPRTKGKKQILIINIFSPNDTFYQIFSRS